MLDTTALLVADFGDGAVLVPVFSLDARTLFFRCRLFARTRPNGCLNTVPLRACSIHTQLGRIAVAAGRAVGGAAPAAARLVMVCRLVQITTGAFDLGAHIGDAVGGVAGHALPPALRPEVMAVVLPSVFLALLIRGVNTHRARSRNLGRSNRPGPPKLAAPLALALTLAPASA